MGVPAFYRWLVDKYPKVVVNAIEEKERAAAAAEVAEEDSSFKNPNGLEFDNLYLDMNGIIHPCFHPDDHASPPTTFQEVFEDMYEYIDRLFYIVRPRQLLYMAIDGVAPRAKMNQQRSRRFRTSKDNDIAEAEETRLRREFELAGKPVIAKQESEVSDPNVITPGTKFMHQLSKALQNYVDQRLRNDAGWKKIKVIISDANVPGEGEHKIMSFIRLQRASPGYNPNTRHCLYGLDADLIMLALATHELHFSILREDILVREQQPECQLALETTLSKVEPTSLRRREGFKQADSALRKKPYQFLHVWILREYLELDLNVLDPPGKIKIDVERIIDDFVFMCFFTGNDFLPHMPTLQIHEGAIDLLMHVYKQEFKSLGGYLVDMQWAGDKNGRYVNLKRVEKLILSVGAYEEKIFKKRSEIQERRIKRLAAQYSNALQEEQEQEQDMGHDLELDHCATANGEATTKKKIGTKAVENSAVLNGTSESTCAISEILPNTKEFKEQLKSYIRERSDLYKNGSFAVDKVKLGAIGWKVRYYKEKFSSETKEDMERTRKAVVQKYTEGLCWVILYYFSGVPSWTWFYPYHYGPFASDLRGLSQVKLNFQKGSPFKPFDQLMGVLPPRSSHALPIAYRPLMTSEESNILDFYPTDFEVDEEGKRFLWQAICKLPFIEEERLLSQTKKLEVELEDEEAERNTTKVDTLFVRSNTGQLGTEIVSLYQKQHEERQTEMVKKSIVTNLSCGISGFISRCSEALEDHIESQENNVFRVLYELPTDCQHVPRLLEGVNPLDTTITEDDIAATQLWHEYYGSKPSYRSQYQQSHRNGTDGKSSFREMHKDAGFGWGGGRGGKPYNNSSDSNAYTERSRNFPAGHGGRLATASSSSGGQFNGHFVSRGIKDLRISESREGCKSFGRSQAGSTYFGMYRNYDWRRQGSVQPTAAPPGPYWDGSCEWRQGSVQPASVRPGPRWDGNYEWRQCSMQPASAPYSPQWDINYGWRQGNVQPAAAGAPPGPRWDRNFEWRQGSVQPAAAAPYGRGWERWPRGPPGSSTSHARGHSQSQAGSPSMHAHGRGQ